MTKKSQSVKGWKIFDKDLKCRDFQFEIGKTFAHKGAIGLCEAGFHFHRNVVDLFEVCYEFDPEKSRVCEVTAIGDVIDGENKSVTNKLTIGKELSWNEVLLLVNVGKGNSGRRNSGDWNSGNWNSGNWNSGNWNSGNWNSGHQNSGHRNSGHQNSGHRNSGDWNSGDRNSGNWNSGDRNSGIFNKTDYCSGIFNSIEQPVPLFNGAASVLMSEFIKSTVYQVMVNNPFPLTEWVDESYMTDEEKKAEPKFFVMGGYLKVNAYEYACKQWWKSLGPIERGIILDLPGFDKKIFKEITSIEL